MIAHHTLVIKHSIPNAVTGHEHENRRPRPSQSLAFSLEDSRPLECRASPIDTNTPRNIHAVIHPPRRQLMPTPHEPAAPPTNMPLMNSVLSRLLASGRSA